MDNAEDFVQFACNEDWFNTYPYELLPIWTKFIDGFGFETDIDFDLNTYQSMLLFKMGLDGARPYHVSPPLSPMSEKEKKINVFPNPASDIITIGKLSQADEWQQCDVVSIDGKILASEKINSENSSVAVTLTGLPKGLYIAVLTNKAGTKKAFRFLKK